MITENEIVTFISNDDNSLEISFDRFLKIEIGKTWADNKDTFKSSKFTQNVPFSFTSLFCVMNELIPIHFENSDFFQCYYYFYPSKLNEMNVDISVMNFSHKEGLSWIDDDDDADDDLDNFDFFDVGFSIFDTKVTRRMSLGETLKFFNDLTGNDQQALDWFKFVLMLQNDGKPIPNLLGNDDLNNFIIRIITNFKPEAFTKIYLSPWVISFGFLDECDDNVVNKFAKCCLSIYDVNENYEIMSSLKLRFDLDSMNLLKAAIVIEPSVVKFLNFIDQEIQPLQLIENIGEHFGLFLQFFDSSHLPPKFSSVFLQHPNILDLSEEQKQLICKNLCENVLKKSTFTCRDIKNSLLRYDYIKFICQSMLQNPLDSQMKIYVNMLSELI
jgi:hypothetical protein